MRRCIAWTIILLAGVLCFYPGLKIVWSGPWGVGEVIQPGTAIVVRLLQPLTSASAAPGEPFVAYVVASETLKAGTPLRSGTLVEGTCLAVRRATGDSRPGYIRLTLQGLRDSEGRFAPLETTTFSVWGGQDYGSGRAIDSSENLPNPSACPPEGRSSSDKLTASADALLPPQENIKFVVLKPSIIPTRFYLP
jgi:hypothetical protein